MKKRRGRESVKSVEAWAVEDESGRIVLDSIFDYEEGARMYRRYSGGKVIRVLITRVRRKRKGKR